jgi:hypothetical protein
VKVRVTGLPDLKTGISHIPSDSSNLSVGPVDGSIATQRAFSPVKGHASKLKQIPTNGMCSGLNENRTEQLCRVFNKVISPSMGADTTTLSVNGSTKVIWLKS